MAACLVCKSQKEASENYTGDACSLLMIAYILAGLAMMLNIRLSYSSAPYALIRFRLPENLFSVFVRRMASSLELWCLPSMLLGNIMDLFQKLFDGGAELRPIKANATDIRTKAGKLKSTADSQSTSEITTIKDNDIKDDNTPGRELTAKAGELRGKASGLHGVADALETAANDGPLNPLETQARDLKEKAGDSTSGNKGLYGAANELATHGSSGSLEDKAKGVIDKFELVKAAYDALSKIKEYKEVIEGKSGLESDKQQKVKDVEREYKLLEGIYNGMLNLTKVKNKATALKSTAGIHSGTELTQLSTPASTLANKASGLSDAAKVVVDPTLNAQAQKLRDAAKKDTGAGQDTSSLHYRANQLAGNQNYDTTAKPVIEQFDTLKGHYDELITESIQHNKLFDPKVQNVESKYKDLKKHYDGMMPFTKIKYYSEKISSLAEQLRTTSGTGDAETVVKYFDSMEHAYNQLTKTQQPNVKTQFDPLKNVYDLMLNVNKMKQPATELDTVATALQTYKTVNYAQLFKNKYDAFEKVFNSITDPTAKSKVTSDWETIKDSINDSIKRWKFGWIIAPSIVTQWLNFLTYVLLLVVYLMGGDQGHLTLFYLVIAISGVVFGINMTLLYSVDFYYIPVYIVGENTFPALTSFIHYIATLMFGNRRKWNSDFIIVNIDIWVAILISFVAAVVWTLGYLIEITDGYHKMKHIHAFGFSGTPHWEQISPALMIVVGMGLVFTIYPGIAPGMIVPFYLVDKIEMVLLIATIFPPVIIAMLRRYKPSWSPQHFAGPGMGRWKEYEYTEWGKPDEKIPVHATLWHLFDLLMVIKISLACVFIYSLHYTESPLSRSIINQPKMSTFLSITYYMCHEILLAIGFSGFIGNDGGDLILIPQYIGALFMIFLAFYSEGYIIEYKIHDPVRRPSEGMWYLYGYYQLNPDFLL